MTDHLPEDKAVVLHLGYKFRLRRTEWVAAVQCALFGLVLLLPGDVYANSDVYSVIRQWFPNETGLGVVLLFIGGLRVIGLWINGARKRVTPWMRLGGALAGAGIFTAISLGFATSGVAGVWIAAWPVLAVIEYINLIDTAQDARQAHG